MLKMADNLNWSNRKEVAFSNSIKIKNEHKHRMNIYATDPVLGEVEDEQQNVVKHYERTNSFHL